MKWKNHCVRWNVRHHVYGLRLRTVILFSIITNPLEIDQRILIGLVIVISLFQYRNSERSRQKRDEKIEVREDLSWTRVSQVWTAIRGNQSLLRKLTVVSTYLEVPVGKLRPEDTLGVYGNPCIASVNISGQPIENLCLRVLDSKSGFSSHRNRKNLCQRLETLEEIVSYLGEFDYSSRWYHDKLKFRRRSPLYGDRILRTWNNGELDVHPIAVLRSLCLVAGDLNVDPRKLRPTDELEKKTNYVRWISASNDCVQTVRYRISECLRIEPPDTELTTLGEIVSYISIHWYKVERS